MGRKQVSFETTPTELEAKYSPHPFHPPNLGRRLTSWRARGGQPWVDVAKETWLI
jgi:hypothetical protein